MNILVIERETSGHNLTYVRLVAKAFLDLGFKVTAVTPAEVGFFSFLTREFPARFAPVYKNFGQLRWRRKGRIELRKHLLEQWKAYSVTVEEMQIESDFDVVFFPTLDSQLGPFVTFGEIDKIFPHNWSGIYMKPQNFRIKLPHWRYRKSILDPNHILKSVNCKAIGAFDGKAASWLKNVIKKEVVVVPDVIDRSHVHNSMPLIETIKKKAGKRRIVVLCGSLEKRKGLLTLIEAAYEFKKDFFFVFAGAISYSSFNESDLSKIASAEKELPNAFFYLDRIADESAFNSLISASDIVYAAYIDFPYSSNLVGKAAFFKKPLIVSKGYFMEETVIKYMLGNSIRQESLNDLMETLTLMSSEDFDSEYQASNLTDLYLAEYSFQSFTKALLEVVEAAVK